MNKTCYIFSTGLLFCSLVATAKATPSVVLSKIYNTGQPKGTEIISLQAASQKAVVSNSKRGTVDIYTISSATSPKLIKRVPLELAIGEELTAVALHPKNNYFLAAIQNADPKANGRIEIRDATTGVLLSQVTTGIGPDAVVIDPSGNYAAVPNEAEQFILHRTNNSYSSPVGSITLIKLAAEPKLISATQIALSNLTGTAGFVKATDHRYLERAIDWNNDGKITEDPVDLNDNGIIDKAKVAVGTFRGQKIMAKEKNGELFMFPITDNQPDLLEPEYPVFSPDGSKVWFSLQENNGVIVIDTATASIVNSFGLGITNHLADLDDNNDISFNQKLIALREPDGIALTTNGKYLVTADEGDTDPKAAKTKYGPTGGGRTISVFDANSGKFIADTGNQIDAMVNRKGFYPESRSDNKGSEPEMVTTFNVAGIDYAAVSLERANGIALVSLANPEKPVVIDVAAIDASAKAGKIAPEGIAHYFDQRLQQHFIYTANEKNGTIAIFRFIAN